MVNFQSGTEKILGWRNHNLIFANLSKLALLAFYVNVIKLEIVVKHMNLNINVKDLLN